MKTLFTLLLMLFSLLAVQAEAPPDIGGEKKVSKKSFTVQKTTTASHKHLQIVAIQAESAELPAVYQFAWSDRLTCGLERLGEFNATTTEHEAIPAKHPRDWLSKV